MKQNINMVYRTSKLQTWYPFAIFVIFSIASLKCWPVALLFLIQALWFLAHIGQKMTIITEGFTFEGRNSLLILRKYELQWSEIAYIEETTIKIYRLPLINILIVYDKDGSKKCTIRSDWFKDKDMADFRKLLKKKKKYRDGGRSHEKMIITIAICLLVAMLISIKLFR